MPDFTGAANMAANTAAKYGGGMNPLVLSGLISGGTSLIQSLLKAAGPSEAEQAAQADYANWEKKKKSSLKDINQLLKPANERYAIEKDLPNIDPAFKKMIMGRLTDIMGNEKMSKYGIDPKALLAGIGQGGGGGVMPEGMRMGLPGGEFAGQRIPKNLAENVLGKYGGSVGKRTLKATEV
jgi:hypothetical protein